MDNVDPELAEMIDEEITGEEETLALLAER